MTKADDAVSSHLVDSFTEDNLGDGDVLVDVEYSSVNYKDGMALAGRVIRQYPLIPGIDLVGTVSESTDYRWVRGDRVVLNGWGMGETRNGGLAERARVSGDWLVRLPEGLSSKRAAAIGTAGFTAMLAVLALERSDALGGEVLVTGAAGGVGSITTTLLAGLGSRVVCSTGRLEEHGYLTSLGAAEVVDRDLLSQKGKPLQGERWSGAVDTVGGVALANVLAQTRYGGAVAACGLAASHDLPTTVLPFTRRGVQLLGINSVLAPNQRRVEAWGRLARDLDTGLLDRLTESVPLADVARIADEILAGRVRGRTVVDVRA